MKAHRLTVDDPSVYSICVQGTVGPDWADYLGGLEISLIQQDPPVTQLKGQVMDQATLIGVINGLYDLSFPLISVELVIDS